MKIIRAICRFAFGILFVLSGFLKAVDPVGTSLKIKEYFGAFHMDFLDFLSVPSGVLLTMAEFLVGVAILKGLRIQLFSKIALGFISFFTLLTLWIAIANPVSDCGCFGEALHLSNTGTFIKNLFLLVAALVVFFQRKRFVPIAKPKIEWGYLSLYGVLLLSLQIYTLSNIPQIDFGIYKPGTDLIASQQSMQEREYETVLVYSKDGEEKEFNLDNLPDSTWTFVDARNILVSGAEGDASSNLSFIDAQGNPSGDGILEADGPVFLVSVYNASRLDTTDVSAIAALADTLQQKGVELYIVSSNSAEQTEELFAGFEILYSDYKAVISLNRSNGGLTYINDGIVVKKWGRRSCPAAEIGKILAEDPVIITATTQIDERLFAEISLFVILFLIVIIRFFSKIIYNARRPAATS